MGTDVPFDMAAMLLSADWFGDRWASLGLVVTPNERALVQGAAREAVRKFMDAKAVYWGINFSPERIRASVESFTNQLLKGGLARATVGQLSDLTSGSSRQESDAAATSIWLYTALTDQLTSADSPEVPPDLSPDALRSIVALWQASTHEDAGIELERSALDSASEWDCYLRELTPDLPTYLSDWVTNKLERPERFRRFWAQLFWVLAASDRQALIRWYPSEAKKLADPGFGPVLPQWMR